VLYAFDGTWNQDKDGNDRDTNVLWFREAYNSHAIYWKGVGTRLGFAGEVAGGISGVGGRSRVKEALAQLGRSVESGDTEIDIVGFSRGAALAVHFANMVNDARPGLPIRFLGLWDCVPSFGAPSIDWNIGWDLDLPDNVQKCYHALALDERRHTFHLNRLSARVESSAQEGRLFEVWFRGVHADVGGGNSNPGLSSIALNWMLRKAVSCGLPMKAAKISDNAARMKPGCRQSKGPWYDFIKQPYRTVRWDDDIHASVTFDTDNDCNNPPDGADLVDDDGPTGKTFKRA
jgi:uncharacterized protein (DUF2235 family)